MQEKRVIRGGNRCIREKTMILYNLYAGKPHPNFVNIDYFLLIITKLHAKGTIYGKNGRRILAWLGQAVSDTAGSGVSHLLYGGFLRTAGHRKCQPGVSHLLGGKPCAGLRARDRRRDSGDRGGLCPDPRPCERRCHGPAAGNCRDALSPGGLFERGRAAEARRQYL